MKFSSIQHKVRNMGLPMKIELNNNGLLVQQTNHYTKQVTLLPLTKLSQDWHKVGSIFLPNHPAKNK